MEDNFHESVQVLLKDIAIPTQEREPQKITTDAPAAPTAENKAEQEAKEPISQEMLESGADLTIGLFDFGQTSLFSFLVKNKRNKRLVKLYGENALDKLERLQLEQEAANDKKATVSIIREFTVDELAMLKLGLKADEIVNGLPLTDQEKNLIKIPLMEIMKQRGGTLPPEYALMLGIFQIAGARTAELIML